MKRILTIFFLATYLILSVGLTIVVHTCGEESEVSLATTTTGSACCCCMEMPMEEPCCSTAHTTLILDDAQLAPPATVNLSLAVVDALPSSARLVFDVPVSPILFRNQFPPPREDITIRYSVLLI
jgi:hypothetical protein